MKFQSNQSNELPELHLSSSSPTAGASIATGKTWSGSAAGAGLDSRWSARRFLRDVATLSHEGDLASLFVLTMGALGTVKTSTGSCEGEHVWSRKPKK